MITRISLVVCAGMCVAEMGMRAVGIEASGYVQGAVFVLTPSMEDWMTQLSRPPLNHAHRSGGGEQPLLAQLQFRVEFKGYGPWIVSLH
jgi:hypothetical protein